EAIEQLAQQASTTGEKHPDLVDLLGAAVDAESDHDDSTGEDAALFPADDASRPAGQAVPRPADDAAEQLAEAADEATSAAGALADLVALETALPVREKEIADRREALTSSAAALETLIQQAAARPAQREQLVADREQQRAAASALGDARLAQ